MEINFPNKYEYYTYEEFLTLQKEENRFKIEYDNGFIFSMAPAHPNHDRVKNKIATAFINHLGFGGMCEVFTSDIAVVFENQNEIYEFQPDIMVCCNPKLFHGPKYKGIPRLIVEILSYSTEHRDRTIKLSVYEKFQVPEYWIVDISNECIEVYSNNINGKYCSINKYKKGMSIKVFDNLVLDVDEIFSVIK
ncbi:Uma2 family endonuclease [Caldicellulosiruptor naganoensis]|uniref:Uma2 family endonuclease n=1 Tax=Caldicellulosiruptor naganoensis TaxID=29324 RepID=A0ABY7BF24_9FIRM|nr:Uma2 family endonuclease [Caldicellulosiruptor naganoensis]WAM31418.1 Uma2 family endonuclease [Caldicellulosiruptor naganoensis]